MQKTLCITMDLDPLSCYRNLYGIKADDGEQDPVMTTAIDRLAQLLAPFRAKATFFVVGQTLDLEVHARSILNMSQQGFEIANHTWSHPYDLSHLGPAQIDAQVHRGAEAIKRICGKVPVGFRAPGYLLGPNILNRLECFGIDYDASVLPSPGYQALKVAAVAFLKLRKKNTSAILGDPRESLAPCVPYRPDAGKPWRRGSSRLVELPISRFGPVPLTGSLLSIVQRTGARLLARILSRMDFVHLELHGVDLLDIGSDRIDPALSAQPDLRISWQRKATAIAAFISGLMGTHEPLTLSQAARRCLADL